MQISPTFFQIQTHVLLTYTGYQLYAENQPHLFVALILLTSTPFLTPRHTTNCHSTKPTRFAEMPPTRSGYLR